MESLLSEVAMKLRNGRFGLTIVSCILAWLVSMVTGQDAECHPDCICANTRVQCSGISVPANLFNISNGTESDREIRFENIEWNDSYVGLVFRPLSGHIDFFLDNSNVSILPFDLFYEARFTRVSVDACAVTSIHKLTFQSKHKDLIKNIQFTRTFISALDPDLFRGLAGLEKVNFAQNRLSTIHPTLFSDLNNLMIVNLSFNSIMQLPTSLFTAAEARRLKRIDLQNNSIESICDALFASQPALIQIELGNNSLGDASICAISTCKRGDGLEYFSMPVYHRDVCSCRGERCEADEIQGMEGIVDGKILKPEFVIFGGFCLVGIIIFLIHAVVTTCKMKRKMKRNGEVLQANVKQQNSQNEPKMALDAGSTSTGRPISLGQQGAIVPDQLDPNAACCSHTAPNSLCTLKTNIDPTGNDVHN